MTDKIRVDIVTDHGNLTRISLKYYSITLGFSLVLRTNFLLDYDQSGSRAFMKSTCVSTHENGRVRYF